MNNKILKEAFIIALLFMVIMFAIGILFYDASSIGEEEIVSIEYITDDSVDSALTEIQSNSGVDVKNETSSSLLKSYSVNANDLNIYASENSYESGKKDPFAEYSETIEEVVTTTSKGGTINNSQSSNPISSVGNTSSPKTNTNITTTNEINPVAKDKNVSNKTESSNSEGTFFENKNSK